MSWLLGKAEDLLNKVDQAAGQTLVAAGAKESNVEAAPLSSVVTDKQSPSFGQSDASQYAPPGNRSMSVPQLNKYTGVTSSYLSQTTTKSTLSSSSKVSPSTVTSSNGSNGSGKVKRDKDEELFEFLNAPDSDSNGSTTSSIKRKPSQTNLSRHSRNSSASSTFSNKSGKIPDMPRTGANTAGELLEDFFSSLIF